MKSEIVFVKLNKTIINRYQTDSSLNMEKVMEIVESVKRYRDNGQKGLLELPTARLLPDGCHELAFGRHRREAFQYLFNIEGDGFFDEIPLRVQELSDQEMLELMGIEQLHRRDVGILEIAETFRRHMVDFKHTSVETADAFGKSEEYVRSAIRMLNLPDVAKERIQAGILNITGARAVLTLTRLLPKDKESLQDMLDAIQVGELPEQALADALRMNDATKFIHDSSFSDKAKSFKYLPALTGHTAVQALDCFNDKPAQAIVLEWGNSPVPVQREQLQNVLEKLNAINPEYATKLQHLLKPPACTACPWHAQVDGSSVCGWVACFGRKEQAHKTGELQKISEKTGIAIYTEADGSSKRLSRYENKHKTYFDKKGADLRLKMLSRDNYMNRFEGIPSNIEVVVVGKTYDAWKKADEKIRAEIESHHDTGSKSSAAKRERSSVVHGIIEGQTGIFLWETITPLFTVVLDGVTQVDFLERLVEETSNASTFELPDNAWINEDELQKMKKPALLAYRRKQVIQNMLDNLIDYNEQNKVYSSKAPIAEFAKWVQGLATTWGVKLPKDFDKQVQAGDEAIKLAVAEYDNANGKAAK